MPLRVDLLDDALEAATSRGLVRRAYCDLQPGAARLTRHDAEEAVIELRDAVVTLRAGGLAMAVCTCAAHETCRHILAAVIFLRNTNAAETGGKVPASRAGGGPSSLDPVAEIVAYTKAQLTRAFGKTLMERAVESLPAEATITTSGSACVIVFAGRPDVLYVAGGGIKGMICKGSTEEAGLLCAQALLAVRRAQDPHRATGVEEPAERSDIGAMLDGASALLVDWALTGLASAPQTLEDRMCDAAIEVRAAGLFRLSAELRRLSEEVRRRRERDAELASLESLRGAARAFALIEALRHAPADPSLRGHARETFSAVGELALVGCGFEIWRTPTDAKGATAYFYAPAGRRWFSASLARSAGQDPGFVPEEAAQRDAVWGSTLNTLSASEVSLHRAAAAPGGRLSLSRGIRASFRPALVRRDEIKSWEGSFQDWSALDAFVRKRFAPSLRSPRPVTQVAVLLPARTGRPSFDEIAQELVVTVLDVNERPLALTVDNVPHHRRRMQALEEILARQPPDAFFVTVAVAGERLRIRPYALLIGSGTAPVSLDRYEARPQDRGPPGLPERESEPLTHEWTRPSVAASNATVRLLAAALDALLGLAELGGQMQHPGLIDRLGALATRMQSAGLQPPALLLTAVKGASGRQRAASVLVAVHALSGLLQMLRLPAA
jgi:hypothetical protein